MKVYNKVSEICIDKKRYENFKSVDGFWSILMAAQLLH